MTLSRRDFLRTGFYGGAFLAVARGGLAPRLASALAEATGLSEEAMRTLAAAADVIVVPGAPFTIDGETFVEAAGGGDLDAYLGRMLAGEDLYLGGPTRAEFSQRVDAPPYKRRRWEQRMSRLTSLLERGAAMLDDAAFQFARTPFADLPPSDREGILRAADVELLDLFSRPRHNLSAAEFFDALYNATLESVYGDPAYKHPGAPTSSQLAWKRLGYAGDQFRRDPETGELTGGFEPEELAGPARPGAGQSDAHMTMADARVLLAAAAGVRASVDSVMRALLGPRVGL